MRLVIRSARWVAFLALLPGLVFAHAGHGGAMTERPIEIRVTEEGFVPAKVVVPAGRPVTVVFRRTTERTCATEVVFPALRRRVALPLDRPVHVTLRPRSNRSIEFACGMGMYSGKIVGR